MTNQADRAQVQAPLIPLSDPLSVSDPFRLFDQWFEVAQKTEPNDPNAMALASVDPDGLPNIRMVLLKGHSPDGFVFYTNFESAKGREILASNKIAINFHWKSLRVQVRARGPVEKVSTKEADDYFASRPRQSQIGAWGSDQSQMIESRAALLDKVAKVEARMGEAKIDRPPHWSGFRLIPTSIEFWADGAFRLHDRFQFTRSDPHATTWTIARLQP